MFIHTCVCIYILYKVKLSILYFWFLFLDEVFIQIILAKLAKSLVTQLTSLSVFKKVIYKVQISHS